MIRNIIWIFFSEKTGASRLNTTYLNVAVSFQHLGCIEYWVHPCILEYQIGETGLLCERLLSIQPQILKTFGSAYLRHRSDTKISDRFLISDNLEFVASLGESVLRHSKYGFFLFSNHTTFKKICVQWIWTCDTRRKNYHRHTINHLRSVLRNFVITRKTSQYICVHQYIFFESDNFYRELINKNIVHISVIQTRWNVKIFEAALFRSFLPITFRTT